MRDLRTLLSALILFCSLTGGASPSPLKPSAVGVGRWLSDLSFTDAQGKSATLSQIAGPQGLVIAVHRLNCPLSMKFSPALARVMRDYAGKGFGFLVVNSLASATPESLLAAAKEYGFSAPYAIDADRSLLKALQARSSTEVFVLDRARTLVYRGPLSDQYDLTGSLAAPTKHYLVDALEAVLASRDPQVKALEAPGCALGIAPVQEDLRRVTYHNRISRLMQVNCQSCHRAGGVAPFPLVTYDDILDFKPMIAQVVRQKLMPPWFASPQHGQWGNDRSLTPEDEKALLHWLDGESVEGEVTDAPVAKVWPQTWVIGQPDLVLETKETFSIPAEGIMPYQYTIVKNPLDRDVWIKSMEIRNTSPAVVHHVLVLLRKPGAKPEGRRGDREEPSGIDGFFAALVPGSSSVRFGDGLARRLPKGMDLVFQLHYTPNGKPATDRASLGLVFATEEPKHEVIASSAYDVDFAIPPGAPNHEVKAQHVFSAPTRLMAFMPHMHLRGKAFRYELEIPGRGREVLLDVPRYDFNWQLRYELAVPRDVPKGAILHATAWYDNSSGNKWNPDPKATVYFGEQTHEEMMIGYFEAHALAPLSIRD